MSALRKEPTTSFSKDEEHASFRNAVGAFVTLFNTTTASAPALAERRKKVCYHKKQMGSGNDIDEQACKVRNGKKGILTVASRPGRPIRHANSSIENVCRSCSQANSSFGLSVVCLTMEEDEKGQRCQPE